jgi:hypothetical protein
VVVQASTISMVHSCSEKARKEHDVNIFKKTRKKHQTVNCWFSKAFGKSRKEHVQVQLWEFKNIGNRESKPLLVMAQINPSFSSRGSGEGQVPRAKA